MTRIIEQLAEVLWDHAPNVDTLAEARHRAFQLRRVAIASRRLIERQCSDPDWGYDDVEQNAKLDKRFAAICAEMGCKALASGDPRGFAQRILFPDGYHNTWGGPESGYGIA